MAADVRYVIGGHSGTSWAEVIASYMSVSEDQVRVVNVDEFGNVEATVRLPIRASEVKIEFKVPRVG